MGVSDTNPLTQLSLPPGFRFYPTDEELLVQYLCRKVAGHHFSLQIIADIDLYKFDPWVLPSKAMFGEKEWYFFSPRDRKYPNGSRPNRVAGSGYWKATGTDKVITTEGRRVGIKKALVFYVGKAPKGTKSNWIMHEYRLYEQTAKHGSKKLDDWVLCRIYKKNSSAQKPIFDDPTKEQSHGSSSSASSQFDDMLTDSSLPEINHHFFTLPKPNSFIPTRPDDKINIQSLSSANFDWATLAGPTTTLPELVPGNQSPAKIMNTHNNTYNDVCVPSFGSSVDEEVQSGRGTQRVENSGLFQQSANGFAQDFVNSVDPSGIRYPFQPGLFGFRQ
ncbi:hypothetical protein CsSME_00018539 [Camellia sinensis var. sinensis]